MSIKLKQKYIDEIKEIFKRNISDTNKFDVFIFGSRVNGTSTKLSDIDIGIEGDMELAAETKLDLEESLDNSNIPYFWDLTDFNSKLFENFKKEAKSNSIYLWKRK